MERNPLRFPPFYTTHVLLRLCTRVRGTRLGQSVTAVLDSSLQRMRRIILDDFGNAAHIFLSLFPSRISYITLLTVFRGKVEAAS